MSAILENRYKSLYTAINIKCHSKLVATNTVYSDTPSIDNISKQAYSLVSKKYL